MGFDNAHAIKVKKSGRYRGRYIAYDHKDASPDDFGIPYAFESAEQLLRDFFIEVDKVLAGLK